MEERKVLLVEDEKKIAENHFGQFEKKAFTGFYSTVAIMTTRKKVMPGIK